MITINKAIPVGNLGKYPGIRYTSSGDAVFSISVATTHKWKDKNTGEGRKANEWHRVAI